jgi:hypothetical protein
VLGSRKISYLEDLVVRETIKFGVDFQCFSRLYKLAVQAIPSSITNAFLGITREPIEKPITAISVNIALLPGEVVHAG